MERTGTSSGTLAPSVFLIIMISFFTSVILTDAASARDRRSPATGGGRESSAQKTPVRPKTPAPSPQQAKRPAPTYKPKPTYKPAPNQKIDRPSGNKHGNRPGGRKPDSPVRPRPDDHRKDPTPRPGSGTKFKPPKINDRRDPPSGGTFSRPPRDIYKKRDGEKKKKKEKGPNHREDKKHGKDPFVPVIGGGGGCGGRPPWHRPPHHHHCPPRIEYTYIYYNYRYVYQPIIISGMIDDDLYGINLPFGPILPWEIGELFIIRLKNLEENGLGGSMLTAIIQTNEEMGWEQFLSRFQAEITDVMYYGPVGRTSFLVGMTVSDILDLMVNDEVRWVGELYPEYKIVPGGRNSKFYVRSLEGDTVGFRRELRDAGVFVMGFDQDTQEYYVRSSQDTYDSVAKLWWVARISGTRDEPFFQPEYEYLDVGMAP